MRCLCFQGYAGQQCQTACPGPGPAIQSCFSHGACYGLTTSSSREGSCICQNGYAGVDAANRSSCDDCQAPRDPSLPSYYGNGTSGTGLGCRICPGGGLCSGHGRCHRGREGNGTCACEPGWRGVDCAQTGTQLTAALPNLLPAWRGSVVTVTGTFKDTVLQCELDGQPIEAVPVDSTTVRCRVPHMTDTPAHPRGHFLMRFVQLTVRSVSASGATTTSAALELCRYDDDHI